MNWLVLQQQIANTNNFYVLFLKISNLVKFDHL